MRRPLRSDSLAEKPPADVPSDVESVMEPQSSSLPNQFKEISELPEHDEFVQMLINAKVLSVMTNQPVPLTWRGYSTVMTPDYEMTTGNMKNELIAALKSIAQISEEERKVFNLTSFFG